MPIDILVKISTPSRLEALVARAGSACSQLLGIDTTPSIAWAPYGNDGNPESPNAGWLYGNGDVMKFQIESSDGVAFATVLDSLAHSGSMLVITPGRTPLGSALGAALAIACAEVQQSPIIDQSLYYTSFAELSPRRFVELISTPRNSNSMEDAGQILQETMNGHLSGK